MFDKFKQVNQIRKIQKEVGGMKFESEQEGVKAVVNGNLQIEEVVLNPDLDTQKQAQLIKTCLNEAFRKAQTEVAQKMSSMM